MIKVTLVALVAVVLSFLGTVGLAVAQTASPSPTSSPTSSPFASPSSSPRTPTGAPATGMGGY